MPPLGTVVLVVEDDSNDRTLLNHAFRKGAGHVDLRFVKDAYEAEDYLLGRGEQSDRGAYPLPDLLLIDLKLPRRSGMDLLAWLKEQPSLGKIPAVVLSSSLEERDIERAYALGARSYLAKSVELRELIQVAEGLGIYVKMLHRSLEPLKPR